MSAGVLGTQARQWGKGKFADSGSADVHRRPKVHGEVPIPG